MNARRNVADELVNTNTYSTNSYKKPLPDPDGGFSSNIG